MLVLEMNRSVRSLGAVQTRMSPGPVQDVTTDDGSPPAPSMVAAADAAVVYDLHGVIHEANDAAAELLGYTREQLLSLTMCDIRGGIPLADLRRGWEGVILNGPVSTQVQLTRADGRTVAVEIEAQVVHLEPVLLRAIARDSTALRRRAAVRSRQYLKAILDNLRDCVLVIDPDSYRLVDVNQATVTLTGYSESELLAMTAADLHVPEERAVAPAAVDAAVQGEAPGATYQPTWLCRDGRRVPVELTTSLASLDEKPVIVATARDVTGQLDAQRLQQARLQRGDALNELTQLALRDGPLNDLLDASARIVVDALGVDSCAVYEMSDKGTSFSVRAGHALDAAFSAYRGRLTLPGGCRSHVGYTAEVGEPVVVDDLCTETRFEVTDLQLRHGTRSLIATPIAGSARPYGVLTVATCQPRWFITDEVQFVTTASGVFAAAIERAKRREALAASESRYRTIVETSEEGIWTVDATGVTNFVNPKMAQLLGYSIAEMMGRSILAFADADQQELTRANLERRAQGIADRFDARMRRKDGSRFWASISTNPMFDADGRYIGALAMVTDETSRYEVERFRYQALHDRLTGLANRVLFDDRLGHAIELAARQSQPLAVLHMDLDHFKPVNDLLGHHAGDEVLRQLAARLRAGVRESDTVARIGGDEFAVILPGATRTGALAAAKKLLGHLQQPFVIEGRSVTVGMSIGASIYPEHGQTPEALLRRADTAMYLAKRGRTGYAVAGPVGRPHAVDAR